MKVCTSIITLVSLSLAFLCSVAFASDQDPQNDVGVALTLKESYPNYSFEKVVKTEVPGVFLVYGKQNVIYFVPETGHLILGDIWDSKGTNITDAPRKEVTAKFAKVQQEQAQQALGNLDLSKAVVVGNGPKKIIEVTDPDCPHCKKASDYLETRDDVTRYIFFMPLDQIHPTAKYKASYILSAEDKEQAYRDIMAGKVQSADVPQEEHILLAEHRQVAKDLGVRGTPAFWVNGTSVSGANIAKLNQLLQ